MLCFRDMTFCAAECLNEACPRNYTAEVDEAATRWWNGPGAPVAFADFSGRCAEFQPRAPQEPGEGAREAINPTTQGGEGND